MIVKSYEQGGQRVSGQGASHTCRTGPYGHLGSQDTAGPPAVALPTQLKKPRNQSAVRLFCLWVIHGQTFSTLSPIALARQPAPLASCALRGRGDRLLQNCGGAGTSHEPATYRPSR
jgi:hypothetical protein